MRTAAPWAVEPWRGGPCAHPDKGPTVVELCRVVVSGPGGHTRANGTQESGRSLPLLRAGSEQPFDRYRRALVERPVLGPLTTTPSEIETVSTLVGEGLAPSREPARGSPTSILKQRGPYAIETTRPIRGEKEAFWVP